MQQTLILGAGVIGLSAAITLQRAGIPTRILARDLPPNTPSSIAAAFSQPSKVEPLTPVPHPRPTSFLEFARLAAEEPAAGVVPRDGAAVFPHPIDQVWYHDLVPNYRRLTAGDPLLPHNYADGYAFTTFIVETPRYLPWLLETYQAL